jgi:hypothetical protein
MPRTVRLLVSFALSAILTAVVYAVGRRWIFPTPGLVRDIVLSIEAPAFAVTSVISGNPHAPPGPFHFLVFLVSTWGLLYLVTKIFRKRTPKDR